MNLFRTLKRNLSLPTLLLVVLTSLTGCARSLREDGTKIAQQGSVTATQMADLYGSLMQDTVDTYRFDTGRKSMSLYIVEHLPSEKGNLPAASTETSATFDRSGYQTQYLELQKRAAFAHKLGGLYDAFLRLASYDAAGTVSTRIDDLVTTADNIGALKPSQTTGGVGALGLSAIKDFVKNLETVKQNHALIRQNKTALTLLGNVRQFFAAEAPLYKDIARDRATAVNSLRITLVRGEAVVSTGLLDDVLGDKLKFPEPQTPFKDGNLKAFVVGLLVADNNPIAQTTNDACDALLDALDNLIALQTEFGSHQTLSLAESAQQSLTVQTLLDQLKAKNIPLADLIKALTDLQKTIHP